ncbi:MULTISPECIES: ABC transporter substrate-binding protein [Streptomyces]|uniref:Putative secreted solute-binding protein n=2 Tax=Streptomyces scabiei TaxID=1930 RepID=C9ZDV8_STRSW|nr:MULTISPECIES: extracellular solute-binding protein [Streptomyces]KFG08272.1 ABC transporter substrate-binding protein [Streptomyces scabiei]MDW8472744.1 extracellular solute-binding protein [Streptomyces scabiei]MDX2534169.1 extracellular solute-binding protein [Streptomyces scabiei]MDX2572436.1 extracellular solute-binding protein [Streptomyces scabiei]MDX2579544.1 extracellular solute-binding protein [Streptomyces scabiei]
MRHNARTIVAVTAALGLAAGLSGCGSGADAESRTVSLTVVATNYGDSVRKNSEGYWDRVALAFGAAHPGIDVDVRVYGPDEVEEKVAELVERGEAPDIVQTDSYSEYAARDLLYSADEVLSVQVQASFVRSLANAGEMDRAQYGLPFTASTRLLYYNKDLFARAGLKPPKTWDQLQSAARALKAQGVKYPIAVPLGPEEAEAETLMWLLAGDGGYTDSTNRYDIASPANVATLTWLKENLVGEGLTGPVPPGELNRGEAVDAFLTGDAAMVNAPLSLVRQIADSSDSVPYGAVPLPSRDGKETPTMGTADWVVAFRNDDHRAAIGEFLDFLYTDKYVTEQAAQYELLPVTTSAADAMRADKTHRALWSGLDTLQNLRLYPVAETDWSEVAAAVRARIGGAVTAQGNPRKVLESIARVTRK